LANYLGIRPLEPKHGDIGNVDSLWQKGFHRVEMQDCRPVNVEVRI
jgi:hypothetical protein